MAGTLDKSAVKLACMTCGQGNRLPVERLSAGPKCGTCGDPLMSGKVAELDPITLGKVKAMDDVPVVVDFWAPWCGPCRQMAPEFSKAASLFKGHARFAKIDTQAYSEVSAKFAIRGIPLLILFQNGREVARLAGARPASEIVDFVKKNGRLARHPS
ncbi:Thioredoxin-2 [Aquimixticola soesokkakensis]|uniref:Thioredoxin-2 n=1 Tax=Aquimixticola soesokkakensis TaxID=1519096 RepID=A0A1Y5S5W7_9RHOB|nr:thioredoxin TrxC [Aquimixticola soesokkakensis]SLN33209.1 Thioredoxin-2 [Aquimixticola soesokkakensis]